MIARRAGFHNLCGFVADTYVHIEWSAELDMLYCLVTSEVYITLGYRGYFQLQCLKKYVASKMQSLNKN